MKVLIPITLYMLVMAYLSDKSSLYQLDEQGNRIYICKENILYFLMALGAAIFVGLRTWGNDTGTYRMIYNSTGDSFSAIAHIEWANIAAAPGLTFCSILLKSVGATFQNYLMVFALFTIITYLWFIRKYTSDIWLSVFFFLTMGVYTFSMAAIKQTTAVAFLVIATDRAINKKWWRFIFWVLIAELFHPYAFIYLIIPLLFFSPWSKRTYILLIGTIVVAILLPSLMNGIFAMTDSLGYNYSADSFVGEGVNIFRVLVVWAPIALSFLASNQLRDNTDRVAQVAINASMVNAMVMFIGLFGTANYFARLANYFLIFQTLALPYLFRCFNLQSKKLIKTVCVVAYFCYFYYASAIAQGGFDRGYTFMSLFDFIKQLF